MKDFKPVTLTTLCDGELEKLFQHELKKVMLDIRDQNSSPTKSRKVTLEVIIKPDKSREMGEVELKVKSVTCGSQSIKGQLWFGSSKGQITGYQEQSFDNNNLLNAEQS